MNLYLFVEKKKLSLNIELITFLLKLSSDRHVKLVSIIVDKGAKLTKSLILEYKEALANYLLSGIRKQKHNVLAFYLFAILEINVSIYFRLL